MRKSLLMFAGLALAACSAPEPWTREDQARATNASFPGHTSSEIVDAAEQVLRLADPDGVTFEYRDNGFVASRSAAAFFIIGGQLGQYIFDFSTEGSSAELRAYSNTSAVTTMGVLPQGQVLAQEETLYALFFSRMRVLLDGEGEWVPCLHAARTLGTRGGPDALCLNAEDTMPAE